MLPLGVGTAVSTRVGTLLGARRPGAARRVPLRGLACFFWGYAPLAALVLVPAVQRAIASLFVADAHAVADDDGGGDDDDDDGGASLVTLFARVAPWVVVEQFFDGIKEVLNGTLRGLGQQAAGVATSVVAYAVVMVRTFVIVRVTPTPPGGRNPQVSLNRRRRDWARTRTAMRTATMAKAGFPPPPPRSGL